MSGGGLISEIFERAGEPGATALVGDDGTRLSYRDLDQRTAATAAALWDLGVASGDRVAVLAEKSTAWLVLALGILRSGAVLTPVNPALTRAEVAGLLNAAAARLIICDPQRIADAIPRHAPVVPVQIETLDGDGCGSWRELVAAAVPRMGGGGPHLPDGAPAVLLYTSGTTGAAKGAPLTQGNLRHNARSLCDIWELRRNDVNLHVLPLFHAHGLLISILPTLWAGACVSLRNRFDINDTVAQMGQSTTFMGVPFHYARLAAHPDMPAAAAAVRMFICGSAPLPQSTRETFERRAGAALLDRYAMTETLVIAANRPGRWKPGSVGLPLEGVEVRITDLASGAACPVGEVGMVEVRGPNIFPGYWNDPEATAAAFRPDGFFVTGDVGRLGADGFLSLSGRAKDIIIYCGMNVHPLEVEEHLRAQEGVLDAAVFGVPHPDFGEAVVAAVVAAPGASIAPRSLRQALVDRMAEYKLPKRIVEVESLPRNAMNKVRKSALSEAYADLFRRGSSGSAG